MSFKKKFLRIILKVLAAVLSLALLVSLGVALILAQPQPDQEEQVRDQSLLASSPAVTITDESDMRNLVSSFPEPVMSFIAGSGFTFVSGTSADTAVDGGFGRVASLYWQTPEGDPVVLQSIYPAILPAPHSSAPLPSVWKVRIICGFTLPLTQHCMS